MTLPPPLDRLRLPVLTIPLPDPRSVAEACRAGLAGCLAAGPGLAAALDRLTATLAPADAPFAVRHPDAAGLEACISYRAPLVVAGAHPATLGAVHSYGGRLFAPVSDEAEARAAMAAGADGLVLHGGARDPFPLVQALRAWHQGVLALGGVPPHGAAILAAQAMGADLVSTFPAPGLHDEYAAARARLAGR